MLRIGGGLAVVAISVYMVIAGGPAIAEVGVGKIPARRNMAADCAGSAVRDSADDIILYCRNFRGDFAWCADRFADSGVYVSGGTTRAG